MLITYTLLAGSLFFGIWYFLLEPLLISPKARIPGPKLFALTKWRVAYEDWRGEHTRTIHKLHQNYGPVVRIGPNEVHFNSLEALQKIYGAGSGFERVAFYNVFDVYGKRNLFTLHSVNSHSQRKKLLANLYSKSTIMKAPTAGLVEKEVSEYMKLLEGSEGRSVDLFETLHYFSIDSIANFVYGSKTGGTSAIAGNPSDRSLLNDILDPARRKMSFFAVHLPRLTKWLYTRTGLAERLVRPVIPMQKPTTYTGIRAHALKACYDSIDAKARSTGSAEPEVTVIAELLKQAEVAGMDDLDIASECADHLLAGIDTTADTLMYLFWALSLSEHKHVQDRLATEIASVPAPAEGGLVEASDKLVYLDAVIKETLRLYAPLPATEPRSMPSMDSVIDGYTISAGTVVGMSPYSLHRNKDVFPEPLKFDPDRWLIGDVQTRMRWFWAFSSGGRMCIGKHLAMAEMTALTMAVYRLYTTAIAPGFEGIAPAITSRFECFYDESCARHMVSGSRDSICSEANERVAGAQVPNCV